MLVALTTVVATLICVSSGQDLSGHKMYSKFNLEGPNIHITRRKDTTCSGYNVLIEIENLWQNIHSPANTNYFYIDRSTLVTKEPLQNRIYNLKKHDQYTSPQMTGYTGTVQFLKNDVYFVNTGVFGEQDYPDIYITYNINILKDDKATINKWIKNQTGLERASLDFGSATLTPKQSFIVQ